MKFKMRPRFVDAMCVSVMKDNHVVMNEIVDWVNSFQDPEDFDYYAYHDGVNIFISDIYGTMIVGVGDWIVKDGDRFCFYHPDAFEKMYELVR